MIGTTIAHYRVLSLLGRGGMGEVYLAENLRLQKRVALKFLSPALSQDGLALDRLQREARAAAELDHPNIARIHDMQEADGRHFLVMEYVEGETLSERLAAHGRLEPQEAERIAGAIAAGLEHAHGHGIVHRDIKSANVMLTPDGGVKILDFGLALRPDVTTLTQQGAVLGTLAYMSPEQVRGAPVDARTDLWSLGVVLYECLSGRRPFDGPSAESTIHNILKTAPHSIVRVNPTVPPVLDGIVARLLEKDPTRRYATARDVLRDLGQSPSSQRTVAWLPRVGGLRRRWPALVGIALAIALIPLAIQRRGSLNRPDSRTPRLAVVGFADLSAQPDSLAAAGLTALLQVGLADVPGCEMVAPEYLRDIQRREFGSGFGPIDATRALQVAREAGASFMVSGEFVQEGGASQVLWRITDTKRGKVLASGKENAESRMGLADRVSVIAAARLGAITRIKSPAPLLPVTETVTANPEAYHHYVAGLVARDDGREKDAQREFLLATELDSTFALAHFELSKYYSPLVERALKTDAAERAWQNRSQLGNRDALLLEGYRLWLGGKVSQADDVYDSVLVRWPDCKEALIAKTENLGYFRRFRQCERAAKQGLRYYPQEPALLGRLVGALISLGEWENALDVARRIPARGLQSLPSDDGLTLANTYLLMGNVTEADSRFQAAISADPENIWPHIGLSACLYARGDLAGAIRMMSEMSVARKWTQAEKQYLRMAASSFMSLPVYYADAGRILDAHAATDGWVDYAGIWILLYAGLYDQSVSLLQESEMADMHSGARIAVLQWGVRALARAGELQRAREVYTDLVRRVAEDADLPGGYRQRNLEAGVSIELVAGAPRKALEYLEELKQEGTMPSGSVNIQLRQLEAETYAASGDLDRAINTLEVMLRTYGGRALGHLQLAEFYEKAGRNRDARREYRTCLALWKDADPDYPYPARVRERLAALERP